jgi:exonuclease III
MPMLRVLTYNIYLGGKERLEAIYEVLVQTRADIISLTEADDRDVVASLAQRLKLNYVWAEGSGNRHIATLARFPIIDWQTFRDPPLTQVALETRIEVPSAPLTIYNLHLLPYLLLPFEIRRWQAAGKLLQIINERQPGRHLIVGDLNAIAPGDRVMQRNNTPRMRRVMALQFGLIFRLALPRLLKAGYTDCFRHLHPRSDGFTWYPGNPTTRYDYILTDAELTAKLKNCQVVNDIEAVNTASDHFPLLADFGD